MSQVTTHVLDLATGRPAGGIAVVLERVGEDGAVEWIAAAKTGADGRVADLGPAAMVAGVYRLRFDTGSFHRGAGFYPEVAIAFHLTEGGQHYHVPLLLGPWGYTTYRGS
jgi:5-hydroxyisourate hydrolase